MSDKNNVKLLSKVLWMLAGGLWPFPGGLRSFVQLLTCTEEATQVAAKCLQKTNIYIYIYIYI